MKALAEILEQTIEHLAKSEASDWDPLTPSEVIRDIARANEAIANGRSIDKNTLKLHFAPTSSIQEIAMSNGWTNEYLKLAEQFDQQIK